VGRVVEEGDHEAAVALGGLGGLRNRSWRKVVSGGDARDGFTDISKGDAVGLAGVQRLSIGVVIAIVCRRGPVPYNGSVAVVGVDDSCNAIAISVLAARVVGCKGVTITAVGSIGVAPVVALLGVEVGIHGLVGPAVVFME
jgi:hypothetical protein